MSIPADVLSGIDPQTGLGLAPGINPSISGARDDSSLDKYTWNYTLAGGSPMTDIQQSVAANISKKSLGTQHSYAPAFFEVTIDTTAQTMVVVLNNTVPTPPPPADKADYDTFSDQSIIDKLVEKLTLVRDSYLPSGGIPFLYERNGDVFDMRIPDATVADLNTGEFEGIADFLDTSVSTDLAIPQENVTNVGSDVVDQDDDIVINNPVDDIISRVQNGEFKVFINTPMSGMLRAGVALANSDPSVATVVYEESTHCIVVTPVSKGTTTISYTLSSTGTGASATDSFDVTMTGQPVVTLVGASTVSVNQNGSYTEQGANSDGGEAVTVSGDTVDPATPGVYTITYIATNAFGDGVSTRVVTVVDNIDPVITVTGDNPLVLQQFDNFIDPGATATDNGQAIAVVTTGSVDTDVAATYTLTYTATDAAGNTTTATRSVEVQPDTTAPVITILGDNPLVLQQFATFTDPGATSDGGEVVSTSGTVNTTVAATYTLTYTATDAAGNTTTATRSVEVQPDTTAPVITILGDNPLVLQQFDTFTDPGATSDGGEVVSTTGTVNTTVAATYTLTYSATDAAGNTGTATRTVEVEPDTTAPVITLNGANPLVLQQFDTFTDPGATSDGGEVVSTTGTVNTSVAATYTLTYSATDGTGNTGTATRSVEVQPDTTAPVITILGDNPLVLQQFDTFTDPGATSDGGEVVSTTGTVNTSVAATYTLTYSATDGTGNTGTATRTVEVEPDTTAPVITLNGANPLVLQQFDTFTDPGATSDGGEVVSTTGTVNTSVAATYTLTYSATDAVGNTGTITRSVEVEPDTTAPVITILGDNPLVLQQFDTFTDPGATSDGGEVVSTTGTVNTSVAATYTLTYTATDAAGNTGTATRSVEVQPDTTAPVITILGDNPLVLQQFDTFTDPGATSDGGEVVSTSGTVNTTVAATYTLTYSATDGAGNTGTATRSVEVQPDTTAPVITILGDNPLVLQQFDTFTDPGATSDGGEVVSTSGTVNTTVAATYTLTYSATDAAGNTGTATRSVEVQPDTTAPVITLIGANPLVLQQNATFTDPGATSDGSEVVSTSGTVNTAVAATYTLTYSATDAAGNTGTTTRSVVVQAPTFPPSGYTQFALMKQTASNWFGLGYASSLNNSTWLDGTHSWSDGAGSYHNTFSTTTTPTKILIAKPDGSWTIEVDYDDLTSGISSYYQQAPYDNPAVVRKYLVPITTSGSYTDAYDPATNTVAATGGTTVNMSSFTKLQVFTVTSGYENNNSWTEAPLVYLNTGTIDVNAPRPIYIEDQSTTSSAVYTPISDIAMYVKY